MNKIAIVSGATSGIGLSILESFVTQGIFTIALGRNEEKLNVVKERLGPENVAFYCIDLSKTDDIVNVAKRITREYGAADILVNCAGVASFQSLNKLNLDELKNTIDVNLIGTIALTKEVANEMIKREKGQVINIESIAAVKGFEYGTSYVSSKFGLAGFSQVLWNELKKFGIKVCSIRPGLVDTKLFRSFQDLHDIEKALSPSDISYLVDTVINQSERSNISEIVVRPINREAQNLFFELVKKEVEGK